MWAERAKSRALEVVARVLARHVSSDRVNEAAARIEHWRTVADEALGAFWHFGAMPSRRDVRQLQRRVASLRRRVAELDLALAEIERRAREDPSSLSGAREPPGTP